MAEANGDLESVVCILIVNYADFSVLAEAA
jgi:hypothetical protein